MYKHGVVSAETATWKTKPQPCLTHSFSQTTKTCTPKSRVPFMEKLEIIHKPHYKSVKHKQVATNTWMYQTTCQYNGYVSTNIISESEVLDSTDTNISQIIPNRVEHKKHNSTRQQNGISSFKLSLLSVAVKSVVLWRESVKEVWNPLLLKAALRISSMLLQLFTIVSHSSDISFLITPTDCSPIFRTNIICSTRFL